MTTTINPIEASAIKKATRRLIPFLMVCYFLSFLDRVNVSFAAKHMGADLGLTATAFGFGAGIFFLTYFLCEVPSNLILERVGARKWIARIMLSWGLVSASTAFVSGETSFYIVRLLLGAAEAGFFPGIIFFLTLWFPSAYRARIVGYFMAAIPISTIIGAPISGMLLGLDGMWGLKGWQIMFLLEAIPVVFMAFVVYYYLTDKPSDAHWLTEEEKKWLMDTLSAEAAQRSAKSHLTVRQIFTNRWILTLAAVYFGAVSINYGVSFFLPQIIQSFGHSDQAAGFIIAIPYIVGAVTMILWGKHSDKHQERRFHCASGFIVAAIGIAGCGIATDPLLKIAFISLGAAGIFGCLPAFWAMPTSSLNGASAAAGIAVINSFGNLAGFTGPYTMGYLKDQTGTYTTGLVVIASIAVIAAVIVLLTFKPKGTSAKCSLKLL